MRRQIDRRFNDTRGPLQNPGVDIPLVGVALVFILCQWVGPRPPDSPLRRQNLPRGPLIKLSLNDATANELGLLPQIGPKMAQRIIHFRNSRSLFRNWAEFGSISGVGPATIQTIQPYCAIVPVTEDLASNH